MRSPTRYVRVTVAVSPCGTKLKVAVTATTSAGVSSGTFLLMVPLISANNAYRGVMFLGTAPTTSEDGVPVPDGLTAAIFERSAWIE